MVRIVNLEGAPTQPPQLVDEEFIITREGRIIKRFIGFSQARTPTQIREALEEALAAKG